MRDLGMDEDQGCPSALPTRVQFQDTSRSYLLPEPLHPTEQVHQIESIVETKLKTSAPTSVSTLAPQSIAPTSTQFNPVQDVGPSTVYQGENIPKLSVFSEDDNPTKYETTYV